MPNSQPNSFQRSYQLDDLSEVALQITNLIDEPVILFQGEMGSGKTTLIKAVCSQLGVNDEVNSPTFALMNEYLADSGEPIYHFDFYRLEEQEEALDMGVDEYFESQSLCMVEWPEKISKFLPANFGLIKLKTIDSGREVIFYPRCTEADL